MARLKFAKIGHSVHGALRAIYGKIGHVWPIYKAFGLNIKRLDTDWPILPELCTHIPIYTTMYPYTHHVPTMYTTMHPGTRRTMLHSASARVPQRCSAALLGEAVGLTLANLGW